MRHARTEKGAALRLPLLGQALGQKSLLLLDLALDVLVPPLSLVVGAAMLGTLLAAGLAWFSGGWTLSLIAFLLCDLGLVAYVGRGWSLSGVGPRGLLDLAWAPLYMMWKVTLLVKRSGHKKGEWVRTAREGETR